MHIVDMLKMEYIIGTLKSKGKPEVLKELSRVFLFDHEQMDPETVSAMLMAREGLGSTGIGDGIAIPHGKMPGLSEPLIAFGRSSEGIPFDSLDGKPAHLFFVIIAPESSTGVHLKILARLSRILKDSEFRSRLLQADSVHDIYAEIAQQDASF
jgi:nitrogen PTS system EIIA component